MFARVRAAMVERDKGFTLIELLVVIIIIGILAAIAIPVFLNQRKKAVDASLKSDIRSLATAMETWNVDHPSDQGAPTRNDIRAGGFRMTTGNSIASGTNTDSGGYCIIGANPGSTAKVPFYFVYDSVAGGFLVNGTAYDFTGAAPAGSKACDRTGPGVTPWVWQ